jgi:hypothetical protein
VYFAGMETKRIIEPARVTFIVLEALELVYAIKDKSHFELALLAYAGAKYQTDASNAADAMELVKNYTPEELTQIMKTYAEAASRFN